MIFKGLGLMVRYTWWWRTMEDRSASGRMHMDPFGHGLFIGLWMIGRVESGSTFSTIAQIHDAVEVCHGNLSVGRSALYRRLTIVPVKARII